jgi:hypothetical protein
MNGYDLFPKLSDELALTILTFFREGDRGVYKSTVSTLATQRNLRPVFVLKKPKEQQMEWLRKTLGMRYADEVANNLMQIWLMQERQEMLITFLDAMEITHDGEGSVEDELPEQLDPVKLKTALDTLFDKFGEDEVRLYLTLFQGQMADGWEELTQLMASDSRCTWPGDKA